MLGLALVVTNITDSVLVQFLVRACLAAGHRAQAAEILSELKLNSYQ